MYTLNNDTVLALKTEAMTHKARYDLSNHRTECKAEFETEVQSYSKRHEIYAFFEFSNNNFQNQEYRIRERFGNPYDSFETLAITAIARAKEYVDRITHWLDRADAVRGRYGKPPMNMKRKRKLKDRKHANKRIS